MKKLFNWLFGSTRSVKEMKPLVSRGGNFDTEKSVKKNEIPQRGQFNIMVDYGNENSYKGRIIRTSLSSRELGRWSLVEKAPSVYLSIRKEKKTYDASDLCWDLLPIIFFLLGFYFGWTLYHC